MAFMLTDSTRHFQLSSSTVVNYCCGNPGIVAMPFAIYLMEIENMDPRQQTQQTKHSSAD